MSIKQKTELTQKELLKINEYIDNAIINKTKQVSDQDIIDTIKTVIDYDNFDIRVFDSPNQCYRELKKVVKDDIKIYWSLCVTPYAELYKFAKVELGVVFDQDKYDKFALFSDNIIFIAHKDNLLYTSRKPISLYYNDVGQLHNENGMSCQFADGWGIYTINGVYVTEQIVMHPESITLNDIHKEKNEEVKRIMIEKYGWSKYLHDTNAEVVDGPVDNFIEGTKECLLQCDIGTGEKVKVLFCVCPSTQKEFTLEVPPEVKSCVEAQSWLSGGLSNRIISAS